MARRLAIPGERSFGELAQLPDRVLCRIAEYCDAPTLRRLSEVSRVGYQLHANQQLWKTLCLMTLEEAGRVDGKVAAFQFKRDWKLTYCRPERLPLSEVPDAPVPHAALKDYYQFKKPRKAKYYSRDIDVSKIPLVGRELERVHVNDITADEFYERYDKANKPVIISGVMDAWNWAQWSKKSLLKKYGDTIFKTNGVTDEGRTLRMRFRDYCDYCEQSWGLEEAKPMYIFDNKIEQRAATLLDDYNVPPYFRVDMFDFMSKADRPDYRWLLIGPQGSGAPFHTDPHNTHAWNVVSEGRKRIAFYEPEVIPPGVDEELIYTEYYASTDTMEWYVDLYPQLKAHKLPIEGIVEPGEMVFIPSGWWHQVLNISPMTIAITQNVCTQGNFNRVWHELQRRGPKSLEVRFKRDVVKHNYKHLFDACPPLNDPPPPSSSSDTTSTTDSSSDSSSDSS